MKRLLFVLCALFLSFGIVMKARIFVKLIAIAFFLVCVSSQISNAEPLRVEIIDSYYHEWGYIEDRAPWPGPVVYEDSYDNSAIAPISVYTYYDTGPGAGLYAAGSAYEFGVSAASSAMHTPGLATAESQVEANWTFTTLNEVGQIAFNADERWSWEEWGAYLKDVTTGQVMFNYYAGWVSDDRWVEYKYRQGAVGWLYDMQSDRGVIDVDFTPGDLYSLYLFAHTQNNDDISSTFCNLTNLQVPEPSTMLLLGLGVVGLAGVRRFKK